MLIQSETKLVFVKDTVECAALEKKIAEIKLRKKNQIQERKRNLNCFSVHVIRSIANVNSIYFSFAYPFRKLMPGRT
jgi:hypothetical protein